MKQKNEEIVYNGKVIEKKHFRVYIFSHDGKKKLVNNYDEYEAHLSTGVWYDSLEAIPATIKHKSNKRKPKDDFVKVQTTGTFEVTETPDIENS